MFYTSVTKYGNNILFRGRKDDGVPIIDTIKFKPTLFVKSSDKNSVWKSFYTKSPLQSKTFDSIKDASKFIDQYADVTGFEIHGDIGFQYQYIANNFPGKIVFDQKHIDIAYVDIETVNERDTFPDIEKADTPICLISIVRQNSDEKHVFSFKQYTGHENIVMHTFADEYSMLNGFIDFFASSYPDIMSGWNIDGFDTPYIINRIKRVLSDKHAERLSPFGILIEKEIVVRGKKITSYDIVGVVCLDYLNLYKKFGAYSRKESYSLDNIAFEELGEKKIEAPTPSFFDWYTNHFNNFVEYNAHDSNLVKKLDRKKRLMAVAINMAYHAKCNFADVFSPVRTWDVLIYNFLLERHIAIPQKSSKSISRDEFEGAYVKETLSGLCGWGMSFDFTSLYPTIIRQWNISPETFLKRESVDINHKDFLHLPEDNEYAKKATALNACLAANGTFYNKAEKGTLPQLMEDLMVGRSMEKKKMLKNETEAEYIKKLLDARGVKIS